MAVLQGARPQSGVLRGGRHAGALRAPVALERRPRRVTVRAHRGVRPAALVLTGIVAIFLLGLVHLTQTLQAAAVTHEIEQLRAEQAELQREIQTQLGMIARWQSASQVIEWAQQHRLEPLGSKVRVPAE